MNQISLYQRWIDTFSGASLDRCAYTWGIVSQAYGERHRHYHTLEHITAMFEAFDTYFRDTNFKYVITAAIFGHDLVYIPGEPANELLSAHLYRFLAAYLGEKTPVIDPVCMLIEGTQHHQADNDAEAILYDLDLLSLGAEPDEYDRANARIRREYAAYSDELWQRGRLAFIETYLARHSIFQTEVIQDWFEHVARSNLQRERSRLLAEA